LGALPVERRRVVVVGVVAWVEKSPLPEEFKGSYDRAGVVELLRGTLRASPVILETALRDMRNARPMASGRSMRDQAKGWILQSLYREPGVEVLAGDADPEVRAFFAEVVRAWPVKGRREMLAKRAEDADERVRGAAQRVMAEVKELREMAVEGLVSNPAGGAMP
jgi:hypothetical protein